MKKWSSQDIRELRLQLGWSQAEFARHLGCRQQTISEWETGLYEPQNAYSKLLEIFSGRTEEYQQSMMKETLADKTLKEAGLEQISTAEVVIRYPTFDPQID